VCQADTYRRVDLLSEYDDGPELVAGTPSVEGRVLDHAAAVRVPGTEVAQVGVPVGTAPSLDLNSSLSNLYLP
jgi:hypothetical protein